MTVSCKSFKSFGLMLGAYLHGIVEISRYFEETAIFESEVGRKALMRSGSQLVV